MSIMVSRFFEGRFLLWSNKEHISFTHIDMSHTSNTLDTIINNTNN